jgi:putative heme-binding domain-containing protein
LDGVLADASQPAKQLHALWAKLYISQAADNPKAKIKYDSPISIPRSQDEYVAGWQKRLEFLNGDASVLRAAYGAGANASTELPSIGRNEQSGYSRLILASALQRLPEQARCSLAAGLLTHAEDVGDHNLPLMYWYGIRDVPPAELVKLVDECRIPLVRKFIARRVAEDIDKNPGPINTLLHIAVESKVEGLPTDVLQGMSDALKGWRKAAKPEAWDLFAARVAQDSALQNSVRDLNVLFGDGRALDEVREIALDGNTDTEARRAAVRTLVEAKSPDTRKVCEKVLTEPSLALEAVQGLATLDDPAIAELIVKRYRSFYTNERAAVMATLVSRPSFAKVLLAHVGGDGAIQRGDITPIIARQIRSFQDAALTQKLAEVWGEQHESSEDKVKQIAALKAKLTPEVIMNADPSQGRLVFSQTCAVCHRLYGEGQDIGPDLTGSGRHDINYLVDNIVDPSAIVAADFTMSVITLKDGRVFNGIIHSQSDRTLTVKMIGQEVTVEKSEITKREQLPISMMPEGLLTSLGDEKTRDLIAYLMSNGQVALPQAAASAAK